MKFDKMTVAPTGLISLYYRGSHVLSLPLAGFNERMHKGELKMVSGKPASIMTDPSH